ncbi:MAG TPA: acyltransferase family protein [Steroidobacteraceae bacterium]|jgi:peptidoglycan/LPS O-acetylase OafA/YrhL|nr:acyltransferase family protein [Steroidobacteraceae bacterium]
MPHLPYRADIDGLRAVAVVAVILCHAGVPFMRGGFAGVDVFFVISGFLITQLLVPVSRDGSWRTLGDFYLRRARRILPALFVMMLVVTLVAAILFVPSELEGYGSSLRLASVMLGNIAGWRGGYYFDAMTAQRPLLHVWSVAVEEQFYLAFPWLLLGVARFAPRRLFAALAFSLLASLAFCLYCSQQHAAANYYLAPTRGWELLLGACIAVAGLPGLARRWLREAVAAVSLVTLAASFVWLRQDDSFPNLTALAPCLATVGLLAVGRVAHTSSLAPLQWRPVVFTGLVSYSLYLWHAPMLVFFERYNMVPPTPLQIALVLVGVYAVSVVSYLIIEQPVRRRRALVSNRRLLAVLAIAMLVLVALAEVLILTRGLPQRFDAPLLTLIERVDLHPQIAPCTSLAPATLNEDGLCRFGPGESHLRAIAWGDSHAATLMPAFEQLAQDRGVALGFAAHSSCRPLPGVSSALRRDSNAQKCEEFNEAMFGVIERARPELVILAAHWSEPGDRFLSRAERAPEGVSIFSVGLERTLARLAKSGTRVCVVLDVPELRFPIPSALLTARQRGLGEELLTLTLEEAKAGQAAVERDVRALAARYPVDVVDPKDALCASGRCEISDGKNSYYRDTNHLTVWGAARVTPSIDGCFASLERSRSAAEVKAP